MPKREGAKASDAEPTRGERIVANGGRPLMPPISEAEYLMLHWQEVGMVGAGAMGAVPLLPSEILAWQVCSGVELEPWEFRALLEMSRAYIAESHEAQKPERQPPYGLAAKEFDREVVSRKVSNAFQSFIQSKAKQ